MTPKLPLHNNFAQDQYLSLAKQFYTIPQAKHALAQAATSLPRLSNTLFIKLTAKINNALYRRPSESWALASVTVAAARQCQDHSLLAQALFYQAVAGNAFTKVNEIDAIIDEALALFRELTQPAWEAACQWQRFALIWRHTNASEAECNLAQATATLNTSNLTSFASYSHVTLAHAQIRVGQFEIAQQQLETKLAHFTDTLDQVGLLTTYLVYIGLLLRAEKFHEAISFTHEALLIAQSHQFIVFEAHLHLRLGYGLREGDGQLSLARVHFEKALLYFQQVQLEIQVIESLRANTVTLGLLGEIDAAASMLQKAYAIGRNYINLSLFADLLLDMGWFERRRGNHAIAIQHFQDAKRQFEQAQQLMHAHVCEMNIGRIHLDSGNFQQAVTSLEQAYTYFHAQTANQLLIPCLMWLSQLFLKLKNPQKAFEYNNKAHTIAKMSKQPPQILLVAHARAEVLLVQRQLTEAIYQAKNAIVIARRTENKEELGQGYKLLGIIYNLQENTIEALSQLKKAHSLLEAVHSPLGQAESLYAIGECYQQLDDLNKAHDYYLKALHVTDILYPSISWQVHANLAQIAQKTGTVEQTVNHLLSASQFLAQIRYAFWQPHLLHHYWREPEQLLGQLISLGSKLLNASDLVDLIDKAKASTLEHQLRNSTVIASPPQLKTLKQEIFWLLSQLNESQTLATQTVQQQLIRAQLQHKITTYQEAVDQIARQTAPYTNEPVTQSNSTQQFQQAATRQLQQNWLTLQYYLLSDKLIIGVITTANVTIHITRLTPTQKQTLAQLNSPSPRLAQRDLLRLGQLLIPSAIIKQLHPTKNLMLIPHQVLHYVPWSALKIDPATHLVEVAVPTIVPSLQTAQLLWQKTEKALIYPKPTLVLAISKFDDAKKADLPEAILEAELIRWIRQDATELLLEENATFDALLEKKRLSSLSEAYDCLHFATHAMHDSISGYLSHLTLADQAVSLHDLQQLAPLPSLVIFSACSGAQTYLLTGDEHVGLINNTFVGGAKQCIAHLWQVYDEVASQVMIHLYQYKQQGHTNSVALALAQRTVLGTAREALQWGGYMLYGVP